MIFQIRKDLFCFSTTIQHFFLCPIWILTVQDLRLVSVKGVLFLTPVCRRKAQWICSGRSQKERGCGKQLINIHDLLHLDGPFAFGHTAGQSSSHSSVPPNQAFFAVHLSHLLSHSFSFFIAVLFSARLSHRCTLPYKSMHAILQLSSQ